MRHARDTRYSLSVAVHRITLRETERDIRVTLRLSMKFPLPVLKFEGKTILDKLNVCGTQKPASPPPSSGTLLLSASVETARLGCRLNGGLRCDVCNFSLLRNVPISARLPSHVVSNRTNDGSRASFIYRIFLGSRTRAN